MSEDTKIYPCIAVIGREPFDDEDSCCIYQNMTREEAIEAFEIEMYESYPEEQRQDRRDAHEAQDGATVYINQVLVSDSLIREV